MRFATAALVGVTAFAPFIQAGHITSTMHTTRTIYKTVTRVEPAPSPTLVAEPTSYALPVVMMPSSAAPIMPMNSTAMASSASVMPVATSPPMTQLGNAASAMHVHVYGVGAVVVGALGLAVAL